MKIPKPDICPECESGSSVLQIRRLGDETFECAHCGERFTRDGYETCERCGKNPKRDGFERCKPCINHEYGAKGMRDFARVSDGG